MKAKKTVGSAGIIAVIVGLTFYVFTPDQVDLRSTDVQGLVIHCSATPEFSKTATAKNITDYHMAPPPRGHGEKVPPYNAIVGYDSITWYRPWNNDLVVNRMEVSWGSANYNICFYNICYAGGMDKNYKYAKNTLTERQDSLLWKVVIHFKTQFPNGFVIGHNQIFSKACPSFNVPKWIKYHAISHKQYTPKEFDL
jgi:hypothetical protein